MTDFQPTRQQSDLADVVEMLLDKGVVINADIAVSIADTQLLGIQVRAAIASFDTAARYGLEFPEGTDMERLAKAIDEPELAERERRRNLAVDPTRGVNVSPDPDDEERAGADGERADDEGEGGERGSERLGARPDPEQPIDEGIDIGTGNETDAEPEATDEAESDDAETDADETDEEATATAAAETEGDGDGD